MTERLDKLLASQGNLTRSEAQRAIRGGRVQVDGAVCRSASEKVDPERQTVAVDSRPLLYRRHLYIMLNKPAGILCVSRDPKAPTVVDLLPEPLRRKGLFPAGRLDKDTVGLVLITDDGDFAHRMLSPRHNIVKRYQAVINAPVMQEHIRIFAEGTSLEDGTRCLPAKLQVLQPGENPLVEIHISEGKYHQIKRMFESVDRKVLWLKRYSLGGLALDETLPAGGSRELTEPEKASVFG